MRILRGHFERFGGLFQVVEQYGFPEHRLDFLRVEQMEQDHFITVVAQRFDGLDDDRGILVGFPGVHMGDPRHDALDVLQTAVRGLSSELGDEVREKRGLAYYVGASLRADADGGWFAFYAGTRLDAVDEVQRLIAQEIERLTVRGLTAVEIARAKNQILAAYEMSLQDNMRLATACAADEMLGLGYDFMFSTPARIEAVTADAIRTAAGSILLKERQAVSVVVPEAAAKDRQNVS